METTQTIEYLGDRIKVNFDVPGPTHLQMELSPRDVQRRWSRCSEVADFLARYFAREQATQESRNLLSTVINEVLENAVKYSYYPDNPIQVEARRHAADFAVRITNAIATSEHEQFAATCRELFTRDLEELYLEKLLHGRNDRSYSGIGLIMLKKDYQAAVGAEFWPTPDSGAMYVRLSLQVPD